eukprot:6213251-Pleurochrysis_carterae.AAC.3
MRVDARKSIVPSGKSAHAIAWWLLYAEETSKKLPDIDRLLTLRRYLTTRLVELISETLTCFDIFVQTVLPYQFEQ